MSEERLHIIRKKTDAVLGVPMVESKFEPRGSGLNKKLSDDDVTVCSQNTSSGNRLVKNTTIVPFICENVNIYSTKVTKTTTKILFQKMSQRLMNIIEISILITLFGFNFFNQITAENII